MKKLIIMVGCPGSGKTTVAKEYLTKHKTTTKYVSRDDIRFSIVREDESYFSHEPEVFDEFINQIKSGLDNDFDVIADATHLTRRSRIYLLRKLGKSLKNTELVAFVVRRPLSVALTQNEYRLGTRSYVPETAVRDMYNSFEMPSEEEGFDNIIIFK